ncbi:hypothetical protein [Endozoicomonas sp. 8E]|uniref:hypothetical protein n=1 Tax=Endozoicomonas sp. 8E TaxID=3035692 RepID=UPI002938FCA1|nr:hypothetical protein [Endozoicomonas sp. 8E]WOG28207.1 hypothetical protein P6910_00740 [Endozoicomonas sp. 8E]
MSSSISRLPGSAKQSIFFHPDKTNHSVRALLSLIIMTCSCSKLLAGSILLTTVDDRFIEDKTTKSFGFLDDLINHNAYIGKLPPSVLNPNSTHLIFAMNHENERGEEMDEHSEELEGAGASQPQPLIQIPLPPMTHAQITAIIEGLNKGLEEGTLNTILSYVPTTLPNESLTIVSMIRQVIKTLNVVTNDDQNVMIAVLTHILGTESPVDMTKPEDQKSLAVLLVSYYTAIHSNGASPQAAYFFFYSFLLHAAGLSGIRSLHARIGDLLGTEKPIESHKVLEENAKESAKFLVGLKVLDEMHLQFLQHMKDLSEAEISWTAVDSVLIAASTLLNYDVNKIEIPIYSRNVKSARRMYSLVKEYYKKRPELVASNSQFVSLIDAINLILDPFLIQSAHEHVGNISSYFSQSNWGQTITDSRGKEQELFQIFEKVLADAKDNPENQSPDLFQELLLAIEKYIAQQLQKTFVDQNDYQVILANLCTGFEDLLEQSDKMLAFLETTIVINANQQTNEAKYDKAVKRQEELSKQEWQRKHLKERILFLRDFVELLWSKYESIIITPNDYDSSDYENNNYDNIDYASIDYGSSDSDSSDTENSHAESRDNDSKDNDIKDNGSRDNSNGDSYSTDSEMVEAKSSDTDIAASESNEAESSDADLGDDENSDADKGGPEKIDGFYF